MKNWIAAIVAALIVVGVGTAIASSPNGSETHFQVADPAVTVIASGQSLLKEGVNPLCEFTSGTTYCGESTPAVVPIANGVCQVTIDGAVIGAPAVVVGVGVRDGEETTKSYDENGVSTTPNGSQEATTSRTRLIPVKAGHEYSFAPYVSGSASGSLYWSGAYVCYG